MAKPQVCCTSYFGYSGRPAATLTNDHKLALPVGTEIEGYRWQPLHTGNATKECIAYILSKRPFS